MKNIIIVKIDGKRERGRKKLTYYYHLKRINILFCSQGILTPKKFNEKLTAARLESNDARFAMSVINY